jgi:hypothetical protein
MTIHVLIEKDADGSVSYEGRTAQVAAMLSNEPDRIVAHVLAIGSEVIDFELFGDAVPVGSVHFCRWVAQQQGRALTDLLSYPRSLESHLQRYVRVCTKRDALDLIAACPFIKPFGNAKAFTGFVRGLNAPTQGFVEYPDDEQVYVSQKVAWLSEWRIYVQDGAIVGSARYDAGQEDAPSPDDIVVAQMIDAVGLLNRNYGPYALDVGVLSTGETALVEMNDAWALGFYKGAMSPDKYARFLATRWEQFEQMECRR